MSHSIKAYATGPLGDSKVIAQLDFTAGNRIMANYTYRCLQAEDYDNGVSGNGERKPYAISEIQTAQQALHYLAKEPYSTVINVQNDEKQIRFMEKVVTNLVGDHFAVKSSREITPEGAIQQIDAFLGDIIKHGKDVILRFG
ncbi:MAG: hypothetical protein AAF632_18545 [Bacteroidota bacterium]